MGDIAGAACRVTFDSMPCDDTRVEQDVDGIGGYWMTPQRTERLKEARLAPVRILSHFN